MPLLRRWGFRPLREMLRGQTPSRFLVRDRPPRKMRIEVPGSIARDALRTRRDRKGDGIGVEIAAAIVLMIVIVSGGTGGTGVLAAVRRMTKIGDADGMEAGAGASRTGGRGGGERDGGHDLGMNAGGV